MHALRHYYAGLLIRYGESLKTVQRPSGTSRRRRHSTPTGTWGRTPTIARGRPLTAFLALARAPRGLVDARSQEIPGLRDVGEWAGLYAGFCSGALLRRRSSLSATRCRAALAAYPGTRRAASSSPVWPCSGRGLPCGSCRHDPGGLLHHPFTLTGTSPAVCFLWHCLADCSGWVLPTALPCGARTFLGVAPPRRDRPADPFAPPSLRGAPRGLRGAPRGLAAG